METEILLADGSVYPYKGKINFSDRGLDPTTGTMTVEAEFPNPEGSLRPGQFVRIRFITGLLKNAMMVPQRAVQEMQGIFQVFVISQDNTLRMKAVEPGLKINSDWVVKNLDASDRVALLGTQFIRAGSPVKPVVAGEAKDKPTAN
jgi:membrane fusion protein (multidrug efflux system)